jgi:phytol kinase
MGLVSFAVSGAVLLGVYGWQGPVWGVSLGVALAAAVLEAFSKLGIDNLTVPLGSAALAFWLSQVLGLA